MLSSDRTLGVVVSGATALLAPDAEPTPVVALLLLPPGTREDPPPAPGFELELKLEKRPPVAVELVAPVVLVVLVAPVAPVDDDGFATLDRSILELSLKGSRVGLEGAELFDVCRSRMSERSVVVSRRERRGFIEGDALGGALGPPPDNEVEGGGGGRGGDRVGDSVEDNIEDRSPPPFDCGGAVRGSLLVLLMSANKCKSSSGALSDTVFKFAGLAGVLNWSFFETDTLLLTPTLPLGDETWFKSSTLRPLMCARAAEERYDNESFLQRRKFRFKLVRTK